MRMGGNGFSLHREQGKEISQREKPLFNNNWPNLFLPSNRSNLVQLCKSMSLLLQIGYCKWILTFLSPRHSKLVWMNLGLGTPIFGITLQLFFPASPYSHIAFAHFKESWHIEQFALQGTWCSNLRQNKHFGSDSIQFDPVLVLLFPRSDLQLLPFVEPGQPFNCLTFQ